jgi:hypothetical protein
MSTPDPALLPEVFPTLQFALPTNHFLIADHRLRILTLLMIGSIDPFHPLIAQEQFTHHEWRMLIPLCRSYPHPTAPEQLLACLGQHDDTIRKAQTMHFDDQWYDELRPVREAISKTRRKLQRFLLAIVYYPHQGYAVTLVKPQAATELETSQTIFQGEMG